MNLVAASLGIAFLSVIVESEDLDDETNINICVNINIGPGCAEGHCPPPVNDNCNKNNPPGPPAQVMKTSTKPSKHHSPEWENLIGIDCSKNDCMRACKEYEYTHSACLLDEKTCHCYGQTINGTQGMGWVDNADPNCENKECATGCNNNGFAHSICIGTTCHCYEADPSQPRTLKSTQSPTTQLPTAMNLQEADPSQPRTLKSTQSPTTPTTKTLEVSNRISPSPLPADDLDLENSRVVGKDFNFKLCYNEPCTYYCTLKKYSGGSCTDKSICHCSRKTVLNNRKVKSMLFDQKICFDALCEVFCSERGHSESICIDEKTCKCGRDLLPMIPPLRKAMNALLAEARRPQKLQMLTHDVLKNEGRDFPLSVCILAHCKYTCLKHKYKKGFCIQTKPPKCHCYQ